MVIFTKPHQSFYAGDGIVDYMPSPIDVPAITGLNEDESEGTRESTDEAPFAALAFKIATDPFVGTLSFFRVYSGVLSSGDTVFNPVKGKKERIGRILQMHANSREEIKEVRAGDIAAAVGLKDVTTGDTLCDLKDVITLERMEFPEPVIAVAVEPKTKGDQEKMGIALSKLAQEDPSFRVNTDEESGQTIISGMGELHLEIIVDRMKREFKVEANVGAPQVAYQSKPLRRGSSSKATSMRLESKGSGVRSVTVRVTSRFERVPSPFFTSMVSTLRRGLSIQTSGGRCSCCPPQSWATSWARCRSACPVRWTSELPRITQAMQVQRKTKMMSADLTTSAG